MADTFTFVRHMMKVSDPEAIQAAIQAGTLAEPYIINITQDSSVSGYESKGIYIQESSTGTPSMNVKEYEQEEPSWSAPYLVTGQFTADPSNGIYTDASGNYYFVYGTESGGGEEELMAIDNGTILRAPVEEVEDEEGEKIVSTLRFVVNSQYLEGWGSTSEDIAADNGTNVPLVFVTKKDILDQYREEWSPETYESNEQNLLAHLAYCIANGEELTYLDITTCSWKMCVLDDKTVWANGYWGEDVVYENEKEDSFGGDYMYAYPEDGDVYEVYVAYQNEANFRAADFTGMYQVYKVGEFEAIDYSYEEEPSDSSTDVSLGYKFTVGQDNSAYFNTGYYPTANTVVQLKGIIQPDGNSSHGIAGNVSSLSEWTYRIFGYGGSVYCDRETSDTSYRLFASVENLDSSVHEYEFGNLYIKVDGSTVATSAASMANYETPNSPMFVFAGSVYNKDNDEISTWHLAPAGTELEYIKFLEPDASGNLQLMMDLRPGIEWPDENKVLYDMVSGDVIYPTGQYNAIEATALDSSSGGDSSSNGLTYSYSPTIHEEGGTTFTVLSITTTMDSSTAAEYNGVYYAICPVEETKYLYYTYVNDEEPEEGEELPMPTASQVIDMYVAWEIIPTEDAPYNGYSYDLALNGIDSIKYMVTNPYTSDCGGSVSLDDEVDYMIIAIPAHCTLYVNQYNDHTEMNYYCDIDSPLISSETFTYSAPVVE